MGRSRTADPRQLSLFSVLTPSSVVDRLPPEVQVLGWLSEPAPLIHSREHNHLCKVRTFRSDDRPFWVHRDWLNKELSRYGYVRTHRLTIGGEVYQVYRPFNRSQNEIHDN